MSKCKSIINLLRPFLGEGRVNKRLDFATENTTPQLERGKERLC